KQKAFSLYPKFDENLGIEDLILTMKAMKQQKECNGKVGTMGFCLGGKLAYLMATRSDTDCNVGYYGVGIEKNLDEADNIKYPLLLHIAELDAHVPKEAQVRIKQRLAHNKKVMIHTYEGTDHAFARREGENYD